MQTGTGFKTPILREILKIRNPLLEEHCAFLEVIHLFQWVGCVRNKLQFRTVQQNPKSSLSRRWIEIRRASCSRVVGSDCFCFRKHDSNSWKTGETRCQWQRSKISRNDQRVESYWSCSLKRPIFASRSFVVCVWGQRSSDLDDWL